MMTTNPTEQMVQAFTQKMRETYVMLGKSLIPMMSNTPEDIQMLLELGEVYETLGCIREAITTYKRDRQLNPDCLPKSVRAFLDAHPGTVV
jgi:hypothetical protein